MAHVEIHPGRLGRRVLAAAIAVALAMVIVAPIALSSGDLVAWARSPQGLGLDGAWPLVVFVALDAAAAVCVGFVIYSAWRGEAAGVFGVLVWLFAGGSALANYRHGLVTPATDAKVFFPAMSLAGPVLLHATVHRVRRWVRTSEGFIMPARARFGLRWLPGVAFGETLEAWRASVRVGISRPDEAVAYVRERQLLAALEPDEAIRYAIGALGLGLDVDVAGRGVDPHELHAIRVWLASRGLIVTTATLQQAAGADAGAGVHATMVTRATVPAVASAVAPAVHAPEVMPAPADARANARANATERHPTGGTVRAPVARVRASAAPTGARDGARNGARNVRGARVRTFKPLSPAEQQRVRAGLARGRSGAAIAKQMGINVQRVRAYTSTLNGARDGHPSNPSREPSRERNEKREEVPA